MNRVVHSHCVAWFVALTVLSTAPNWAAEQEPQGVLDFKPRELLPAGTKLDDIGIRVRLEQAKDPNIIKVSAPSKDYKIEVNLKMDEQGKFAGIEPLHWSKGAVHEMAESISFAGYSFEPDKGSVLTFKVDPNRGYVYVSGKGRVTTPDKTTVLLDQSKKDIVMGHPVKAKGQRGSTRERP